MIGGNGDIFLGIGLVIIIAAIAAYLLRLIRQPQILAYVVVGVFIAPAVSLITGTNFVDKNIIGSMSLIGVAFLLFIVGLEMDIKSLRNVALVSTLGGMIQIILIAVTGYLVALLLGFLTLEAAYIGLFLAFSSTMVVVKLLSDKRELQTLHGRMIIGTLLLQDIVAIFALSILTSVNGFTFTLFGISLIKFLFMFALAYFLSKYVFPTIFRFAAKNQELLLITSLAVCFIFSLAFHFLGFSIAIGAFLAGLVLGSLEYNLQIIAKIKSLKDFFSLLFFVSLGMGISIGVIKDIWLPLIIFLFLILILKPFVIMTISSLFKYTKRPSFLTANALAQVGEFSLILAAQGLALGHITQEIFSLTVILTLISITLTSYYIKYSQNFYKWLSPFLIIFDRFTTEGLEYLPKDVAPRIILCGHNRLGYSVLKSLRRRKRSVLVVDYNPEVIARMVKEGYHCIYGDATDEEIIDRMNLNKITLFISTLPRIKDNLLLIKHIRAVNKKAKIIVAASQIEDAFKLYDRGASYVVLPHFLGGEHVANLITSLKSRKIHLKEEREEHIAHLKERQHIGHEHPVHG